MDIHRENKIYHYVCDPVKRNSEANVIWTFDFQIFLTYVLRADNGSAVGTQKAHDAYGHASTNAFITKKEKFSVKIIENLFQPKSYHYLW